MHQQVKEMIKLKTEYKLTDKSEKIKDAAFAVLASCDSSIAINDLEGRFVYVNNSFLKMVGCKSEKEVLGKLPLEFIPDQNKERVSEVLKEVQNKGKWSGILTGKRKDESIFYMNISARLVKDELRKPICSIASFIDITEQRKAEEALQKSEETLRQFMDSATDSFSIFDSDLNLIKTNKAGLMILPAGTKKEDIIGKNIKELSPDAKETGRLDKYKEVIKTGKSYFVDDVVSHPKYGRRHLTLKAFRVGNGLGIITTDITKRKQAEESLRNSERRFRDLVDLLPITVFEVDKKGNLTFSNRHGFESSGYTQEDIDKGMNALQLFIPGDRNRVKKNMRKILNGEGLIINEYTALRKDGSTFPVIIYSDPIIREKKPVGLRGVVVNITEQKLADKKIIQHQRILEASERELRNFSRRILSIREEEKKKLSTILHDEVGAAALTLSSSLNAIEEDIKNNNLIKALQTITKSKSVLHECVSKLKKIAVDLRPPDLDIIGLPAALKEYFSDVEKQTNIKINFRVDIEEKKLKDEVITILYRIVQEAFNNIIKHANANKVKVNLYSRGNKIKLNIRDNGKGFDIEKSLKSTKMTIGLRGMKERAESLNGTFTIKAEPGQGTKISIILPMIENGKS